MKKIAFIILFNFVSFLTFSQSSKSAKTNQTTVDELKMKVYDKDSTAVALVLYEQGNTYINPAKDYNLSTDYYFRIKILKKDGINKGTIKIYSYKKEQIEKIEGYTYNLVANRIQKKHLLPANIFKNVENKNWRSITFTLPDIKVGSVIEYRYTKTTPYFGSLDGWSFQSDIPTLLSEYESAIIANYRYNISLKGYFPLSKNKPSVIKNCIKIPGLSYASCMVNSFAMKDIPAFKEESYMTSKLNYLSRISFELKSSTDSRGGVEEYTDTWKSADRKFKSGEYFGSELRKSSFFKKNLPDSIISITSPIDRAKKVFYFIQNHFTNNNKNITYSKINTKKTFNDKIGSVAEINISLMNALKAASLDAKVALLTIRNTAKPTKVYPVISEFNYLVVKLTIAGKDYFVDASDKNLEFGITPFKTLNGEVRVMDFKSGSYWQELVPSISSHKRINLSVKVSDLGEVSGKLRVNKTGYEAYFLREKLSETNEDNYLEDYENENKIEIEDYKITGKSNRDKQTTQNFSFNFENDNETSSGDILLNPFFHEAWKINPFKLEERYYPVDFGYKINYSYRANISLPDNYEVKDLPQSKAISLPNNGGKFIFNIKKSAKKLAIIFRFQLAKTRYTNEEYFALKEFFNQIIKIHTTPLYLKKI